MSIDSSKSTRFLSTRIKHSLTVVVIAALSLVGVEIVLGVLIAIFQDTALGMKLTQNTVEANFTILLIARLTGVGLVMSYLFKKDRNPFKSLGFKSIKPTTLIGNTAVFTVLMFVLTALALQGVEMYFPDVNLDQNQVTGFEGAGDGSGIWLAFIALVIVAPVVEEIIFRGFLLKQLAKDITSIPALVVSSLLFGVAHMQINVAIVAGIIGFFAGILLLRTKSLYPAILLHSIKNLIAFTYLF